MGEVSRGYQGTNFHAGLERRFGIIELRGGARHSRGRWHPPGGVGLNVLGAVSFDVAAFSTDTNVERARKLALAVSLSDQLIPGPDSSLARVGSGERTAIKASGSTRAPLSLTDQCR